MKIKNLTVDWCENWANRPQWRVTFDEPLNALTTPFEDIGDGMLLAVDGEQADFFAYGGPGTGFGGREFTITMTDGSTRVLIGPWSGNSGDVNACVSESGHVAEATSDDHCATAITVAGIMRYIDEHPNCGFGLAQVEMWGRTWYEPTHNGDQIKPSYDNAATITKVLR